MNPAEKGARHLLRLTLLLALLPIVLMALGALGTKLDWWGWRFGFGKMTVGWGSGTAFVALFTGLIAFYVAAFAGFRRLWPWAAASLVIPLVLIAGFTSFRAKAQRFPGHDIGTDWTQPLAFSDRVMAIRGPEVNPVHPDPRAVFGNENAENWMDRRAEVVNATICPEAKPAYWEGEGGVPAAMAQAEAALSDMGLRDVVSDPTNGRIEAVAESFWFEFKDDVVLRFRSGGERVRVDIRSVSRVGRSDIGANCARVTRISSDLFS